MKLRSWGTVGILTLVLTGCGSTVARAPRPPTAIPKPTATPTVSLAFHVGVTDVPPKEHHPRLKPTPLPSPPSGPYIRVFPSTGSPVARTVHVYGGHFQPNATVQLVWSSQNVLSSVSAPARSDGHGRLHAAFHIPAASPGVYRIVVDIGGSPLTSASFTVQSTATMAVEIEPAHRALQLAISGRHFVPKIRLTLILYALAGKSKASVLTTAKADGNGAFRVRTGKVHLSPGEYLLRAFPSGAMAQTAETVFQVVV